MKLTQNWVGYLDRSFEQIKRSCLRRLGINAPEISDHSESNPLVIILSFFSGIAETLNLNLDGAAREAFLGTARRYASAVKLVKLIDYNIKARNPSSADLLFYFVDVDGNPIVAPTGYTVPLGTIITANNSNLEFRLSEDVTLAQGLPSVYGSASEYTTITNEIIGITDGSPLQKISLSPRYVHGSIVISLGTDANWFEYRSFGLMDATTKGYIVNIDEEQNAFIQFGDGINGLIPTANLVLTASYRETEGAVGNQPPETLNTFSTVLPPFPAGTTLRVTNPGYSTGGTDFESLEDIKDRAPRSLRTLERAITYQDYLDLPLLVPGVGASAVRYCCGKYVDVFIAPSSRGVATRALVDSVTNYMQCKVAITTRTSVQPSGVTRVWVKAKIYAKPLTLSEDVYNQVLQAWDDQFGFGVMEINKKFSITDLISATEQLTKVDRIEIEKIKIEPYARPLDDTQHILNITWVALPNTVNKTNYRVVFSATTGKFEVYKNTYFILQLPINDVYNDGIIGFRITPGTYANGDSWEFSAFPSFPEIFPSTIIDINDYSAPIIDVGPIIPNAVRTIFSEITIITQGTQSNCLPPC